MEPLFNEKSIVPEVLYFGPHDTGDEVEIAIREMDADMDGTIDSVQYQVVAVGYEVRHYALVLWK